MAGGVVYCFVYANCVYLISWVCNSGACSVFHGYCSDALDCMGDVETEVVPEGGTSRDANQNEEHDIPNVDLDMDYDMQSS